MAGVGHQGLHVPARWYLVDAAGYAVEVDILRDQPDGASLRHRLACIDVEIEQYLS